MIKTNDGFNLFPNTIMAPETFEALPEIEGKAATLFAGKAGKLFKARIEHAWHVVCWTDVQGTPTAIASRVDTRIYRPED
jgi:hypothetical protein